MDDEVFEEPYEVPACENCWGELARDRACSRCARRICKACAKKHRMGPVVYEDLPESDQPPWCRRLTPAEKRLLDRLPMGEDRVRRDVYRQKVYVKLIADGFARWTPGKVLARRTM